MQEELEQEQTFEIDHEENQTNSDIQINEYDLTSTPNDFNILTINSFLDSGAIIIPGFQRNYVWDIKRASKLIESIILGLPVPQIFLYEESRNKFLVIDGQQRLMTIYYFIKQRFPRKEKRTELRKIYIENDGIPDEILHNDEYFSNFRLSLPKKSNGQDNIFNKLSYKSLGDYKTQFDLRPLRNIIVRQNYPTDDSSSVYEIFNRLNSGGMNLRPQEIRGSLYHSDFMTFVNNLNLNENWRKVIKSPNPDLHMKDVELLFRCLSFMINGENYTPSLAKFLNNFAQEAKSFNSNKVNNVRILSNNLIEKLSSYNSDIYFNDKTGRINTLLLESIFYFIGRKYFDQSQFEDLSINIENIERLKTDSEFLESISEGTTNTEKVKIRFRRAMEILDNE